MWIRIRNTGVNPPLFLMDAGKIKKDTAHVLGADGTILRITGSVLEFFVTHRRLPESRNKLTEEG